MSTSFAFNAGKNFGQQTAKNFKKIAHEEIQPIQQSAKKSSTSSARGLQSSEDSLTLSPKAATKSSKGKEKAPPLQSNAGQASKASGSSGDFVPQNKIDPSFSSKSDLLKIAQFKKDLLDSNPKLIENKAQVTLTKNILRNKKMVIDYNNGKLVEHVDGRDLKDALSNGRAVKHGDFAKKMPHGGTAILKPSGEMKLTLPGREKEILNDIPKEYWYEQSDLHGYNAIRKVKPGKDSIEQAYERINAYKASPG